MSCRTSRWTSRFADFSAERSRFGRSPPVGPPVCWFAGSRCPVNRALAGRPAAYVDMERDQTLWFTPVDQPDARVRSVGFDLTDPYVEHCWSAVIGPSSTLLLRRLPTLWVTEVPAKMRASDLSQSMGLGAGVGERSRFVNTLDRIVRFGLARPAADGAGLDVYRQVAPLSGRQLTRVPAWTRETHEQLLGTRIDQVGDLAGHQRDVASITARLDRLQHGRGTTSPSVSTHGQALGR